MLQAIQCFFLYPTYSHADGRIRGNMRFSVLEAAEQTANFPIGIRLFTPQTQKTSYTETMGCKTVALTFRGKRLETIMTYRDYYLKSLNSRQLEKFLTRFLELIFPVINECDHCFMPSLSALLVLYWPFHFFTSHLYVISLIYLPNQVQIWLKGPCK